MKKLNLIFIIISFFFTIISPAISASENCQFNGNRMIVELRGGTLRYIYDGYATAYTHNNKQFKKGKLVLEQINTMNVRKKWQYRNNKNEYDFINNNSFIHFDLTGKSGSYGKFNVYELCE